jgi:CheY-like chemotaxis protein
MQTMTTLRTIQPQESQVQSTCTPHQCGPILVVEDDTLIREIICEVLEDAGYQVESATGGYEGLSKVPDIQPALVLLDMRMPGCDGWQFADTIKISHPLVPIVAMTAASDPKNWATSIEAQAFIAKPFDLDDLVAVVGRFACIS